MTAGQQPGPATITVSAGQVNIVLTALYIAAGYQLDRAEICTDCLDQSCTTCQWRLKSAGAYDKAAAQIIQAAQTSTAKCVTSDAAPASDGRHPAAEREAGQ